MFTEADIDELLQDEEEVLLGDYRPDPPCRGIFGDPHRQVQVFEAGVESSAPQIAMKVSDLLAAAADHGTTVFVAGGNYTITGIHPERKDGKGLAILILTEA